MVTRLRKFSHSLPVLYGLIATQALSCGANQETAAPGTASIGPVYVRTAVIGKDKAGNPKTTCAFVVHPDDPQNMVTGEIRDEGARFKFPDGSLVTLYTNGSTHLFSASRNLSELIPGQDGAATRTVSRIAMMCTARTV
jgi:hypothetical protein